MHFLGSDFLSAMVKEQKKHSRASSHKERKEPSEKGLMWEIHPIASWHHIPRDSSPFSAPFLDEKVLQGHKVPAQEHQI